jgi:hypothetical protein
MDMEERTPLTLVMRCSLQRVRIEEFMQYFRISPLNTTTQAVVTGGGFCQLTTMLKYDKLPSFPEKINNHLQILYMPGAES